jgi:sugar O-acyltransferase (sialic acid O-acetyltransferase NeuD family)
VRSASLLLFGAGGHAAACIDVIEEGGQFTVAGLVGSAGEVGKRVLGYPVLGTDEDLSTLIARCPRVLIVIGQIKTAEPRIRLFERLQGLGCEMPTIVSPRAHVSRHATVGAGTIVMHGAVVNAAAVVGRNCIVNSLALVEHGVVVADHCHIATSAAVNSGVRIGAGTFIGSQSSVRQSLRIGERCVIGMGQRVLADCADGTRIPARTAAS